MDGELEHGFTTAPRMRKGERTRYVPNHRSFGAFIRSDQVRDPVVEAAQDIANDASARTSESKSPSGLHSKVKRGYKVRKNAGLMKVAGNLRVKVEVFNNAPGSALVEFGGKNIARERPLGRAGAKYGDFKPEDGPR